MDQKFIKDWMEVFSKKIEKNKEFLSELDNPIGDSDHGGNMNRGMTAIEEDILPKEYESSTELLKKIAMQFMGKVGGASGALYGSALLDISKDENNLSDLESFVRAGLEGIKRRGKAEQGDKTMVDLWAGVLSILDSKEELNSEKIFKVVEGTKNLQAKKGRASYVGERSIGHIDPGTYSSALLFESYLEVGGK